MLRMLMRRLRALFRKNDLERELDDEMLFHIEREIEQNVARGMSPQAARTAAMRSFGGGVEQFKEEARDARGVRLIEETRQDLRYAFRMMRKTPSFTAIAVLSLALGIGANTALFSVVDSVLLKTLPVKDPNELVLFEWQAGRNFRTTGTSGYGVGGWDPGKRGSSSFHYGVYETLRTRPDSPLSDLFAFASMWDATVAANGQTEVAEGQYVSGGYFSGLGIPAFIGRTIAEEDDKASAPPAAMIGYGYWQSRFGGDPSALGQPIAVNNISFTIVGVTPPGFAGTLQVDTNPVVYVPMALEPTLAGENSNMPRDGEPGIWWVHIMGRLKPGATAEQATASLGGAFQAQALELMPPPKKENESAQIEPVDYPQLLQRAGSQGMTETRRRYTSTIYLLFGVVGLVLLIACANVANMLLARSSARGSEITLRLAIGAGRLRLVRQLLTESLLLAAVGGTVGTLFGLWGTSTLAALGDMGGGFLPRGIDYGLSWRVLAFTMAVSVGTGLVFGLVPALRTTRLDLTTALKESKRSSTGVSRSRLSKALVVAQVAMSLLLLVGAGLFVRTVRNLQTVDVGFNQENLLIFTLRPGAAGYDEDERREQIYRRLFPQLEAVPGVRSATFCRVPLLAHNTHNTDVVLPGETEQTAAEHVTNRQIIRENYFETMEVPLLAGRLFTEQDSAGAQKVAIVSDTFVRKFFPDQDPIGQRVGFDSNKPGTVEIVGVVRDTKYNSQRDDLEPLLYTPWLQERSNIGRMTFSLRAAGDPMALADSVRQTVREVDPALPITDLTTQMAQSSETIGQERVFADLLTFFGGLAVLLAAIGLYGVMAYSVAQRTNEIGIRMALGARTLNVLRLVVWQGLKFALVGLVVGAAAALALKQVVESELYGVTGADPLTFSVVGALLLAIALVACWIPARRATKVDPVVALRNE